MDLVFWAAVVASSLGVVGCHGQVPAAGEVKLSPELSRRVEVLLRKRTHLPPDYTLMVGPREASDFPGYDKIEVSFTHGADTPSKPVAFYLSRDGKTLAQLSQYDISQDPKGIVSSAGRPSRGGGADAPVQIVVFDDLECPFCAKMHAQLFPAMTQRYGNEVHIVYRDFPLSQHPWATHAAVDVNCLAGPSPAGYWRMVDYIHAHAGEFGGEEHSLKKAGEQLDDMVTGEAKKDSLSAAQVATVDACVKKQDDTEIKQSVKLGESLDIGATPVLFINGEMLEGAYPVEDVFRMIDGALVAAGKTPPPPYAAPSSAPAAAGVTATGPNAGK